MERVKAGQGGARCRFERVRIRKRERGCVGVLESKRRVREEKYRVCE